MTWQVEIETPIYAAVLRDRAGREARRIVRTGLQYCPTCERMLADRCRTKAGKPAARDHVGRYR
jgi:hypothetical protein